MSWIELEKVNKSFGPVAAVRELSLSIREGELLTFLGPSGCGKTTTIRLIAGYLFADSGSIRVGGQDITYMSPQRRGFGMVFQNYALFPHMTVAENVAFGLRMRHERSREISRRVDEMLSLVGLVEFARYYPYQLSGGQQQRVALARAVAFRPRVLLMDEPLSALDLKLRQRMELELKRLQQQLGITTVYVTHDQEEALSMSDRVAVMEKGQLVQLGTPEEIYRSPGSRFVADFVGRINFIEARVLGLKDGIAALRFTCSDVELCCQAPPGLDLHTGAVVTLALRPEEISIATGGRIDHQGGECTRVAGVVEKRTYFGSFELLHIAAAGQTLLVAQPHAQLRIGDKVTLQWPTMAIRILSR